MNKYREKIYDIVAVGDNASMVAKFYDALMAVVIVVSLVPLLFKTVTPLFRTIDTITAWIFVVDYILRLLVADKLLNKDKFTAFIKYPFTPMAIVDLLSILPSLLPLNSGFRLFKIFRLLRTLRVFRAFKLFRYSKNIEILVNVAKRQKEALLCVCGLAIAYVTISALIVFNIEPQTFDNFFEAFYWAVVSLTTMGYGDIYPVTPEGRIITMISAMMGIAIVALPAGIITAGYMNELEHLHDDDE